MASVNVRMYEKTHEGGKARNIGLKEQFSRALNSCLLWEDGFYEDGIEIAERLFNLTKKLATIDKPWLIEQIIHARNIIGLRHAPLWCLVALASVQAVNKDDIFKTLFRPDDATELLALYWKDGKKSIPASFKKGFAKFFVTLNEYQLAKYGSREGSVQLRDILFLCHAKPNNIEQEILWNKFVNKALPEPETWEHMLSAGKDKKETFEKLLNENKLGSLALIRNLRNMLEASVDEQLLIKAITKTKVEKIFPYQILQAAKYASRFETQLEGMLFRCLKEYDKLLGTTIFLVDNSGSMNETLGGKNSSMNKFDAAKSIALILREICEDPRIVLFNSDTKEIPARRGFGLAELMGNPSGSTRLGNAVTWANIQKHNRLIVISDEQTEDKVPNPVAENAYLINPSANKNGVGYGPWLHIDGFSTNVIDFILGNEKLSK